MDYRTMKENEIKEAIAKHLPGEEIVNIRQCWTDNWEATTKSGKKLVFGHTSYYPSCLSRRKISEYYFRNVRTLEKVIYWRG